MWDYQYDAENRLIRMASTGEAISAGLPNQVLEFKYDYMGRRVQKRSNNVTAGTDVYTRYVYDGWNVVAEFSATASSIGAMLRSFTWGLDVAGSFDATGGVGALVQITDHAAAKTYFPTYDGSGNVSALVDAADGSLAAVYEYSPFGELLRSEGGYAAANPFRFSTKWTDAESGLSYYGYRYYSSALGRFINRDPIEEQGGVNLYGFAGNNPTSRLDVLGLDWQCVEWEFVAMLTGYDQNGDPTYATGIQCKKQIWVENEKPIGLSPYKVTGRESDAEYYAWLAAQDQQAELRRQMDVPNRTGPDGVRFVDDVVYDSGVLPRYTVTESRVSRWGRVLNGVQTGLDVFGLIPGVGEFADGANAVISLGRGDYSGAALSAAAMIPFAGWGAAGAKAALKYGEGAHTLFRVDKGTGRVIHYETRIPQTNPRNPNPWEVEKRFDGQGPPHFDKTNQTYVPTPHVHDPLVPGGVRPPQPGELPRGYP